MCNVRGCDDGCGSGNYVVVLVYSVMPGPRSYDDSCDGGNDVVVLVYCEMSGVMMVVMTL